MNNLQHDVQHSTQPPYYYEICFFEKPYVLYTYQSTKKYLLTSLAEAPFGKTTRIGVVWRQCDTPQATYAIKELIAQISDPLLTPLSLQLLEFCARYYSAPLQEVLTAAIPSAVRRNTQRTLPILAQTQSPAQLSCLTLEQDTFVKHFFQHHDFHLHLLHGITGSGKTRCYLELIQEQLNMGKNVLLMVPEINLTPQLLDQLQGLRNAKFCVYHSQLTPKKRAESFFLALSGERGIIFVTTRSGVFLPYQHLGLIILDEEHDPSYKQQEGSFRYHGRDCAIKLAQLHHCPCLMGTATPSLKMSYRAQEGTIFYSALKTRATKQPLPHITLAPGPRASWREPLNFSVMKKVRDYLTAGHQVLFYLNRRGYVPRLFCNGCRQSLLCPHCLIAFVYHLETNTLSCHHCLKQMVPSKHCSSCKDELIPLGFGTERLAEFLKDAFPEVPTFVIDTDHLTTHKKVKEKFAQLKQMEQALIVGTQMIGKGHDWPKVQLVVLMISAHELDGDLDEHVAAQFVQAAGRCGRHAQGEVLLAVAHDQILTEQLRSLLNHDYQTYIHSLLQVKQHQGLPPFSHQAKILFQGRDHRALLAALRDLAQQISLQLCQGPFLDYPMKRGPLWRVYLMLQLKKRSEREHMLSHVITQCQKHPLLSKAFVGVDIDPLDAH